MLQWGAIHAPDIPVAVFQERSRAKETHSHETGTENFFREFFFFTSSEYYSNNFFVIAENVDPALPVENKGEPEPWVFRKNYFQEIL